MKSPWSLATCDRHQCLYVSDDGTQPYVVHRIDVRNSSCSKWSVSAVPHGLSVTRDSNVLVTLCSANIIAEHKTDGQLIREIKLDNSDPSHKNHTFAMLI